MRVKNEKDGKEYEVAEVLIEKETKYTLAMLVEVGTGTVSTDYIDGWKVVGHS